MEVDKKELSVIMLVEKLIRENKKPMLIHDIINNVIKIKKIKSDNYEKLSQVYTDITSSAKFVYCGEEAWDLKENNLDLWDKDGYAFAHEDTNEEDDELKLEDFMLEEEKMKNAAIDEEKEDDEEEKNEEEKEEAEYLEVELPINESDDDTEDVDIDLEEKYDEDDYNEIMDDYEDMYDDE